MSIRKLTRVAAAVTALGLIATGCSSGSTDSGSGTADEGTPQKGGTLNMLGSSDVDFMDPNIAYYSVSYGFTRFISRQLYTYPAIADQATTAVPDLATGPLETSEDGKTVTVTIRDGAQWDTSPARPVTGADFVRGVKRTCNPAQPFGGLPDYEDLIVGMPEFCEGFAKVKPQAGPIAAYQNSTDLPGLKADGQKITFTLTRPATYLQDMLTLNAFTPAPAEYDKYVPASAELGQNLISDGPYKIDSYQPTKRIELSRNANWNADSDPIRKAYVDKVVIDQTVTQESTQQQLETGTAKADMEFNNWTPPSQIPRLTAAKDAKLNLGVTSSTLPFVAFNFESPNNNRAMAKLPFRQALMSAISRDNIIQSYGGPKLNPPLTQVLPHTVTGGEQKIDLYPYDLAKAKTLLGQAGAATPTLTMLYGKDSEGQSKMFQTMQADLKKAGITLKGLGASQSDLYSKYLPVPASAKRGEWDLAVVGWGPDWYGNAAASFFRPLFSGNAFPPGGSNYGFYSNPKTDQLIDQALAAKTEPEAGALWHQADQQVMQDAAFFPVTDPLQPNYRAKQVKNAVYIPAIQNFDGTNVWLDPAVNGG